MTSLKARLLATLAWWAWMPTGAFLVWLILRYMFGGVGGWAQSWRLVVVQRMWLPGGGLDHPTGLFWAWVAIGLIGTAVVILGWTENASNGEFAAAAVAVFVAVGVLAYPFTRAVWDNDKDAGRYFNRATTWHITDGANPPASLSYLLRGAHQNESGCAYKSPSDVPTCVQVDKLPGITGWEGRTSSYASAQQMMAHAASPAPKVDVWDDTLTYLYGAPVKAGQSGPGTWTAILDGSGKATPTYGIASWDGSSNTVKVACRFAPGAFDRAFAGARGNSLPNWVHEKYPNLLANAADVWGYCQGSKPVIVIPVTRQVQFKNRTATTAAGVLILTGDHGVRASYRRTVRAGELPGPAYPISLTETQREATEWAAGRKWRSRASFGFKPTVDDVQGNNTAEYLLRAPDGHLYYVTPLTPNASKSQAFIAYAVSPADTATDGRLNRLDVYVLPDGDPRIANLNSLTNKATDAVRGIDPTFLNTGGKLEEFTPLGGDMWRVYGVRRGLTEFYVDLSITGRTEPRTVDVAGGTTSNQPSQPGKKGAAVTGCGKVPAQMTGRELADCVGSLADELRRRGGRS